MPNKKTLVHHKKTEKHKGVTKKKKTREERRRERVLKVLEWFEKNSGEKNFELIGMESVEETEWAEIRMIKHLGIDSSCIHNDRITKEEDWHKKTEYRFKCDCDFEAILKPFPTPKKCPGCPHKIVLGDTPGQMDWACDCYEDGILGKFVQEEIEKRNKE